MRTYEARYDLTKEIPGYDVPMRASGVLRYRRGERGGIEVLFHAREPEVLLERVAADRYELYAPADRLLERHAFARESPSQRALHDALGVLAGEWPAEAYDVADGGEGTLRLVPRDGEARRRVSWIEASLDGRTSLPESFAYATPDGEVRRWRLRDARLNPPLVDADLSIAVPEGTEIVEDVVE